MNTRTKIFALLTASLCLVSGVFASCVVQNLSSGTIGQAKLNSIHTSAEASLPGSPPTENITLTRGSVNKTFTLQNIYDYTQNGTIWVHNYTYSLGGSTIEARGIDPLMLMKLAGWYDCNTFTIKASDGYSKVFNTSKFILADPKIYKFSTDNATILLMAAGNTWLKNFVPANNENYGNFVVAGDPSQITNQYKISNVTQMIYDTNWAVKVLVNGVQNISIGYNNLTSGNYTTYQWTYSGIGNLGNSNYTGITVASIMQLAGLSAVNFSMNFIAVDGYGATMVFTKAQMMTGYTPGDSGINYQGKQSMLSIKQNATNYGYDSGPFWLIIPGAIKSKYIKEIVQINVFTIVAPKNLIATPGNGQVVLMWQRPTTKGNYTYNIYQGTLPNGETKINTTSVNATSYTDTGLTNGQIYYYKVTAVNATGEGPKSNEASATPRTISGAPQNPKAQGGDTQVIITWNAPASNGGAAITTYTILRGTSSGSESYLANVTGNLNYTDTTVTNGQTYYYEIIAVNAAGSGPASTEVSATPASVSSTPGYPAELIIGAVIMTTVVIAFARRKKIAS